MLREIIYDLLFLLFKVRNVLEAARASETKFARATLRKFSPLSHLSCFTFSCDTF